MVHSSPSAEDTQFAETDLYGGDSRGALWSRWDLHVHTPASVEQYYGDKQQRKTWESYRDSLRSLPPEMRAIGINDYFSVEGYRKIREMQQAGDLPNIPLILPAVELRINSLVGNAELRKINLHVLFSDMLSADDIEHFFLQRLNEEIHLEAGKPWRGCLGDRRGLEDLGRAVREATPREKRTTDSDLRVGFRSAAVKLETVFDALNQSLFRGKYLTAIGLSEWDQMRWDGAGAAQKRDIIERVDFVLTNSPSPGKYVEQKSKLLVDGVNHKLLHASDAHYYASSDQPNRLGRSWSWLKADLTFQGLERAIRRFDERVFVGDIPPKLELIRRNRTKYIKSIAIHRNVGAKLDEIWFNTTLPLNPDLVAVIGNQGSGKSALTDVLGLCGNSKVDGYSFLNPDKFCDKQRKASEFTADLTWESGEVTTRQLDDAPDDAGDELVRYVPQGFFDAVTNETAVSERGRFYGEVKKAIFSHVAQSDRLGQTAFDDLVAMHSSAAVDATTQLRDRLSDINQQIIALEDACSEQNRAQLRASIEKRQKELDDLRANPPAPPAAEANAGPDQLAQTFRLQEAAIRIELEKAEAAQGVWKKKRAAIINASEALATEERRFGAAVEHIRRSLESVGVVMDTASTVSLTVDRTELTKLLNDAETSIAGVTTLLDPNSDESLAGRLAHTQRLREERERSLEAVASEFEAYQSRLAAWQNDLSDLEGSGPRVGPDSLAGLKEQLDQIEGEKQKTLTSLKDERRQVCRAIHGTLHRLAELYSTIAQPVQDHIASDPFTRDQYRLTFDVLIVEQGLTERLFSCVNQSTGTFAGVDAGRARLREAISRAEFDTSDGALTFAEQLLEMLQKNYKNTPPTAFDLRTALKKGTSLQFVYDLVFGLEYLNPAFALALNGKPLRKLSPGERGILLLVFYLIVDRGDEPLVIDQPEGNLNNQSIVQHLVPVFVAAKRRRQVILVTHNPNLAVVCDAEQVIHCRLDADGSNRLSYESGSLENPKFTRLSLDLLEGTAQAFESRKTTYDRIPEP